MRRILFAIPIIMFSTTTFAEEQCDTVQDCAQKAMQAAFHAKLALQLAVPKGAVMAFNLAGCPEGWNPFEKLNGRVIVGAGKGPDLTDRPLGKQGGAETHTLSVAEMPSHSHTYTNTFNGSILDNPHSFSAQPRYGTRGDKATLDTGGNGPHNNMQPFHTLLYCERN